MTAPRHLAPFCIAVTLALASWAPKAAASTIDRHAALLPSPAYAFQKAGNAATVQTRKRTTRPPARRPVRVKPKPAPAPSWARTEDPSQLAQRLTEALTSRTRSGQWGAMVVSLTKGDTLFAQNADGQMLPASTMKMYTSAMALDRFGPDFVFKTPVLRDGPVGSDGGLSGNLFIRGVGDPSLSNRFWKGESPMDALARQVVAAGIRHVRGDIIGDASAFDSQLIPDGWKRSYLGAAYAARVSALSLNENLVWVAVRASGNTALVSLEPATTTIPVKSTVKVVGGSGGRITAARQPDGSILVRGTVGRNSPPRKYSLVVDDPAMFTTGALRAALERAGVRIDGATRLGETPVSATEIAAVASPPLSQIVGEMNRESINIVAELLFRAAAASETQVGSAQNAATALREFFSTKVRSPTSLEAADGSGLSELDRVTARSMVELLGYAHASEWGSVFHASLPVEGESGTLRRRSTTPARGNLHAKTGTTNRVASLGGFVTARNGEVLAFSFIYNGNDRGNARGAMDTMGATLAEFSRAH
ncbi:MAG TPA: D-alanyl-D-alanine carboxypeptidase/D-alanyl-D-alanine-endopeptidase [Gemmatimonadaceae bacterium]|nr:D-alanyl-D-alanine carboxypeptidase/D-alanyl-D-alanine-endopeptidase [Gemmatimonadaceae bacterium]